MTVCPSCGTRCPERSRFCLHCGEPLARHRHGQRKVVTVLFADLVGFTAMSESADPEDVDARLRGFNTLARDVLTSHGGVVEKFIGDAVVGVFGVPHAHEDDAERGVRAGLRLVQRMDELPRVEGRRLEVRIGVNTGRALVRLDVDPKSGEGFLVGDTVNTASRLQAAAPPMAVVVGDVTHGLTRQVFEYAGIGQSSLKGKAHPVPMWRAVRPLARTGVGLTVPMTPLVGREREVGILRRLYADVVEEHSPQTALLVGEAGIGKSRLITELARHADEAPHLVTWRTGVCPSYGETTPFWALGEIVKAHAGILEADDAVEVERKLEQVVSESTEREWLKARLRPLVGLEAAAAPPAENTAAWLFFVEELARARPTVLVFEDLQWADDSLLDFLKGLAEDPPEVPLLLLGSARPELLERRPDLSEGTAPFGRLDVRGLPPEHAVELVSLLLLDAGLDSRRAELVLLHCGGNPLYAEEYVRLLAERRTGGGADPSKGDAAPPDTLRALIAARLDVLSRERRALLEDAAVIGLEFWPGALAGVSRTSREEVESGLRDLAARELIRLSPGSAVEGEVQYSFWHALTHEVAYESLPRAMRAVKHADMAQWLRQGSGARVEDLAGSLAHHTVTALELARAAGPPDIADRMLQPAIGALELAGDCSLALDVAAAEGHYRHALELAGDGSEHRPRLLARWARTLFDNGCIGDSLRVFEEGIAGLRAGADVATTAAALGDYAAALQIAGDMQRGRRALEEALTLVESEEPGPSQVDLLARWAGHSVILGDYAVAMSAADEALDLASRLGLPTPVRALVARASCRCGSCEMGGFEDHERALAEAKAQGLGRETGIIYFNFAEAVELCQGPRTALPRYREGLEFASARNDRAMSFSLAYGVVGALYRSGRWMEALREACVLAPQLEAAEDLGELRYLTAVRARLLVEIGESREARSLLPLLEEAGRGNGEPLLRAVCLLSAASVRASLGESRLARDSLATCAGLDGLASEFVFDWHVPHAVRTAIRLGDEASAERLAAIGREGRPLFDRVGPTCSGLLHELHGDAAWAARSYEDAAEQWEELGVPYELALARLGQSRCLLTLDRADDAVAPIREALGLLDALGAGPDAGAARILLRTAGSD